jgi:hypothetical protein
MKNSSDKTEMIARGDRSWVLWAIVAAIGVHIVEEYALNFTGWSRSALSVPLTWEDFHLVNAGVTLFAVACAVIAWRAPAFSLSSPALVILNAAGFHGGSSLLAGYSPGTWTALLLFLPLGGYAYVAAARDGVLTRRVVLLSAAGGALWHLFLAAVFYVKYFAPLYP